MPGSETTYLFDKIPMTIEPPASAAGAQARCVQEAAPGGPIDAALVPWGCEAPGDGQPSWWGGAR